MRISVGNKFIVKINFPLLHEMALSCLKGNVQKLGLLLYSWRDLQEELRERVNGLFSLIKTKNSVAICSKSKYFQEMIQLGPDYDDVWDIISFKINRDIVDSVFDILKNMYVYESSIFFDNLDIIWNFDLDDILKTR